MSSSVSKRIHPNKTCTASTHRHRWMHRHDNRTTLALYLVLGFWGFSSDSDWLGVDRRFPPLIAITSVKNNLQIGPINHSHDNHHVASSPFCTSRHGLNHHARCGDLVRGCFGTCTGVLLFRCGRVSSRILSRVTFGVFFSSSPRRFLHPRQMFEICFQLFISWWMATSIMRLFLYLEKRNVGVSLVKNLFWCVFTTTLFTKLFL